MKKKRVLSLLLALVMSSGTFSMTAFADKAPVISGDEPPTEITDTGDTPAYERVYRLYDSGVLYLDTVEAFYNWADDADQEKKEMVSAIVVGTEDFQANLFGYPNLTEIDFGDNLTALGWGVVQDCPNLKKLRFGKSFSETNTNFSGCPNIEEITINSPSISGFSLEQPNLNLNIIVPEEYEASYKEGSLKKYAAYINRDSSERFYPVTVNGEVFSNKKNVIKCGEGTATFDAETSTLTLENAEITNGISANAAAEVTSNAAIYSGVADLNLVLKGTNVMRQSAMENVGRNVIIASYGLRISGEGELKMYAFYDDENYTEQVPKIVYGSVLEIDGSTIECLESNKMLDAISYKEKLEIDTSFNVENLLPVTNIRNANLICCDLDLYDGKITGSTMTDCNVTGSDGGVDISSSTISGGVVEAFSSKAPLKITDSTLTNVDVQPHYASEVVFKNSDSTLKGTLYSYQDEPCKLTVDGGRLYIPDENAYSGATTIDEENITVTGGVEVLMGAWNEAYTGILVDKPDTVTTLKDDKTGVSVKLVGQEAELNVKKVTNPYELEQAARLIKNNSRTSQMLALYEVSLTSNGEPFEPKQAVEISLPAGYEGAGAYRYIVEKTGEYSTSYSVKDISSRETDGNVVFSTKELGSFIVTVPNNVDIDTDFSVIPDDYTDTEAVSDVDSDTEEETDSDPYAGMDKKTVTFVDYGAEVTLYGEDRDLNVTLKDPDVKNAENGLIMAVRENGGGRLFKTFKFEFTDADGNSVKPKNDVKLVLDCEYENSHVSSHWPQGEFLKDVNANYADGKFAFYTKDFFNQYSIIIPEGKLPSDPFNYRVVFHFGPAMPDDFESENVNNIEYDAETWVSDENWQERSWFKTYKYTEVLENTNNGFPYDAYVFFPTPTLEGAEFLGWYYSRTVKDSQTGEKFTEVIKVDEIDSSYYGSEFEREESGWVSSKYTGNHEIDLFAAYKYENQNGNLILDANGGTIYGKDVDTLEWIPVYDSGSLVYLDAYVPEKEGYKFVGWNTKKDGSGTTVHAADMHLFYSGDDEFWSQMGAIGDKDGKATLYAQWEEREFAVTLISYARYFDENSALNEIYEGHQGFRMPVKTVTVKYFDLDNFKLELPVPNLKLCDGDEFLGWFSWQYDNRTKQSYAIRVEGPTITGDMLKSLVNENDVLNLRAEYKVSKPELEDNGQFTEVKPYTNEKGEYLCLNTSYVELDANGGTIDGEPSKVFGIHSHLSDTEIPIDIPEYTPYREGYKFLGWNTEKDGSGEYERAGRYYTLYAQWQDKSKFIDTVDITIDTSSIKAGDTPSFDVQIPEGAHYFVANTSRLYWFEVDENNNSIETADGLRRFACSNAAQYREDYGADYENNENWNNDVIKQFEKKRYRFDVRWLKADTDNGYQFADNVKVTINGREARIVDVSEGSIYFSDSEITLDLADYALKLYADYDNITIYGGHYSYFEPKIVTLDFKSDDDVINVNDVAGTAVYKYYKFEGWRKPETNDLVTTVKKSDFTGSKVMTLRASFDTINLPSGLDDYYIEVIFGQGTTDKLELTTHAASGNYYEQKTPKSEFKGFTIPDPTIDGAEFLGWFVHDGNTGVYTKIPSEITPDNFHELSGGADVLQIRAAYKKLAPDDQTTHRLTLDANGGTIYGKASETVTTVIVTSGDTQPIDCFIPEREGFTFLGWNSKADGTGEYLHDTGTGSFPIFSHERGYGDENYCVTLYAQWKQNESQPVENNGILGDLDGDEDITSADALAILRISAGLDEISPELFALADVDDDEDITSADALAVLRYSAGLSEDGSMIGEAVTNS